ncbi:hypothetical protein B0181_03130 [Moraxella caviae]|uniref:Uncharacterized protein n=1 Tax=Moraxella caviae TaxID=34060 RepID=A0A1T0A6F5_9GAMM|nr:hypothetical protein [Moraxella caviae]OOR91315.1 hypothetical protein B0181_03130 [Moraxella caviae]STZ13919.1 Uncharacterised protein [Moraxella caviae]
MATFSPTLQFQKRWLAAPAAVKQAFHQELSDIIHMMGSDIAAKDYAFTNPDFGRTVSELLQTQQTESAPAKKFVQNIDTTPLSDAGEAHFNPQDLAAVEARITSKLSAQIDDFLGEHFAQLTDDLKAWLQTAVKNEMAKYK